MKTLAEVAKPYDSAIAAAMNAVEVVSMLTGDDNMPYVAQDVIRCVDQLRTMRHNAIRRAERHADRVLDSSPAGLSAVNLILVPRRGGEAS